MGDQKSLKEQGQYLCTITATDVWEMMEGFEDNYDDNESVIIQHTINVLLPETNLAAPIADVQILDYSYENMMFNFELDGCESYASSNSELQTFTWKINNSVYGNCTSCECVGQIPMEDLSIQFEAELVVEDCYGFQGTDIAEVYYEINQPPVCSNIPQSMDVSIEEYFTFKVDDYCYDPNDNLEDKINSCEFVQNTIEEGCTDILVDFTGSCELGIQLPDVMGYGLSDLENDICFNMSVQDNYGLTNEEFLRFGYERYNGSQMPTVSDGNNLIAFTAFPTVSVEELFELNPWLVHIIGVGKALFKLEDGTLSGNLTELDYHNGYRVYAHDCPEEECIYQWSYDGIKVDQNIDYTLADGNNLIGIHGNSSNIFDIINDSNIEENMNFVLTNGQGLFKTSDGWSGNLNGVNWATGYWINLNDCNGESCEYEFRPEFDQNEENISREISDDFKVDDQFLVSSSMEQMFYTLDDVIIDGQIAKEGDVLLSYNDGILTGSTPIGLNNKTIAVMGRDMTDHTIGYHENGQLPVFKLWIEDTGKIVELRVENLKGYESMTIHNLGKLTGETPKVVISEFNLDRPYPNPFNPMTTFNYSLPSDGDVSISVFNIMGDKVTELFDQEQISGMYTMNWDASAMSAGVYFIQLEVIENSGRIQKQVQKVILLK